MLSFTRQMLTKIMINTPSLSVLKEPKKKSVKRVPSFSSIFMKGSMALEGSMVFPIFLLFIMTVLLSLEVVRLQSNMQQALHQTGNAYAFTGYQMKYENMPGINADDHIKGYMREQLFPYLCLSGGEEGIGIQDFSTVEINGLVHLKVNYGIKPFIYWLPMGEILFEDEYIGHGWTGYFGNEDINNLEQEDLCVYITRTGSRYHKAYDCTYLRIPVKAISSEQVENIRNDSGGKYHACERCGPGGKGTVYITSDGSRYHGRADCSSLKRTVYMIGLSKAQGYKPCSKCGG